MDMRERAVLKKLDRTHSEKEYSMESIRTSRLFRHGRQFCARQICALPKVGQRANWMHLSHFWRVSSRIVRIEAETLLRYQLVA